MGEPGFARTNSRGLTLDNDLRGRSRRRASCPKLRMHLAGDLAIDHGVLAVGVGRDHRPASVRGLADHEVEGHLAEEWDAQPLRLVARTAVAKNVRPFSAVRTEKITHVLNDPEHRDVDALEHRNAATCI